MKSQRQSQLLPLFLLFLAPVLTAQDDGAQKPPAEVQEVKAVTSGDSEIEILPDGSRIIRTTKKNGELVEKHIPPGDPAAGGMIELPPDELVRRGGGYFDASVMVRPRRLAPGESGDLYVHVTLRGYAVVVPGAGISLTFDKAQGPLTFGQEELQPARRGIRETRYKGKPVWDDALTFRVPVVVRSDAKFGQAAFAGSVQLEVTDGRTGEVIGRFRAEAPGQIPIGRPIPRPQPQTGRSPADPRKTGTKGGAGANTARAAADATGKDPGRSKSGSGDTAKATGEGRLVGGQKTAGRPGEGFPGEGQPRDPGETAGPGGTGGPGVLDLAFWGVGGLLVVALAFLVLRRR